MLRQRVSETGSGRRQRLPSRGSITVEMGIVAPLLILLMFGIIEMGLLLKNMLVLGTASREAARVAALGKSTSAISARAADAASSLKAANLQVQMQYYDTASSAWVTLGNTTESTNNAPTGSMVRVTLQYPHGFFFTPISRAFADPDTGVRTLQAATVAMRE